MVILDDIRSAHNVGSIFRTCDGFLAQELLLCGYTAQPPHRDIAKTALGATDSVAWRHFKEVSDAISYVKDKGFTVWAVEQTEGAGLLGKVRWPRNVALLMGNEVKGLSDETIDLCHDAIEVPMFGSKHSFNVSVCAGIVLWEAWKALRLHSTSGPETQIPN